ncbi:MAG: prolyl oligopeptidase family serine peptidase [Burkholderiales bacterium]|nr:prolyl oligopeptidase family serine peptidase [Burkholderiales bacterium]
MRLLLLAPVCAFLWAVSPASPAQTPEGPSVRDIVEFTRIVQPGNHDAEALRQQVSADGSLAFIVTRKADVASDRNMYEIRLLDLTPQRLADPRPREPEPVLSFADDRDPFYSDPAIQQVRWWDARTLVFLGRLKEGFHQVYRLDVQTRQLTQLTHEATPIVSFAASADMRRLVYALQVPNPPMKDGARSVVVGNQSFWSVKFGQQRLVGQIRKYRYYVADIESSRPPRALGDAFVEANYAKPQVSISPDGRWALLPCYERARTLAWSRQYPMVDELSKEFGPALRADPLSYYSGTNVLSARRMVAWRLDDGQRQTVVDAPDDALPGSYQYRADRLWQGGGASVVLGGTHLPMASNGETSPASHVIEYWPDSGRWAVIAKLAGRLDALLPRSDGFVAIDSGKRRRFTGRDGAGWQEVADPAQAVEDSASAWRLRIQEGLNQPPDVVALGPAGQTVRMTTLNPQFDQRTWGAMKPYAWRDAKGRDWKGGLMGIEGTDRRGKLPLVIQTYAFSPDNFYLDGPNTSVRAGTSAYAGRAFVREGILVLAMGFRPVSGPVTDDFQKLRLFNDGVRGAVDALVKEGRVDPERVGIIGWSTTGQSVLNLVTFSDLPIRAATLADGDANTLFSYTLTYGFGAWDSTEAINQAAPVGRTLADWMRNDPALHTECINTALRIESYGVPVYNNWDIYALLRRQYKPAEMIVIPGGFHSLSTPSERMISLQGNVDWYRFWLKGEKRTVPALAAETAESLQAQYDAWLQMEKMKAAVGAQPRCTRPASWG